MAATDDKMNPWGLSEGLPLEGADVTITDCVFLVDNEYAAGALVASMTLIPDEYDGDMSNLRPQLYSLGKGWEAVDKGARAEHESGKFRQFAKQSSYGSWIGAALQCEGAPEYLAELDPRDADTWINTRWTLGTQTYETQEKKEKARIVPVAFLGLAGDEEKKPAKPVAKSAGKAAQAPAKAANKAAPPAPKKSAELDDDVTEALTALAKEHDDFDAFMNAGFEWMEENGKAGDAAIETAVMSKRQYASWRAA